MKERLSITEWPEDERPRERLMKLGVDALSNAELLAILIGSGSADESAVELMRKVMTDCNDNLRELGQRTLADLQTYKGIGPAKAVTLMAAAELSRRRHDTDLRERVAIRSSQDIYNIFYQKMCDLPIEESWILLLNQSLKVIDRVKMSAGGITETAVDVRCVLREALLRRATAVVLCHNHPSGNPRPSQGDIRLTERLKQSCEVMNIKLIDHLVFADGNYYSFADEGNL